MKSYSFDSYAIEADSREPFRLDVSDGEQIVIACPDVDTQLAIEEVATTRERLRLYCGDQYPKVRELLKGKHPVTLDRLVDAMVAHFRIDSSGN